MTLLQRLTTATAALVLALFIAQPGVLAQTTGGPDAYGYNWVRSDDATNGFTFQWIDITNRTGTQTLSTLADDNFAGPLNLGFTFPYYWLSYTNVYVGSNGYLMFGSNSAQILNIASSATGFPQQPEAGPPSTPNNFIAARLCDMTLVQTDGTPVPNAKVMFWTNQSDSAIITFENVPFWTRSNGPHYQGSNTFQVILLSNGDFAVHHLDLTGQPDSAYLRDSTDRFLTMGFENVSGNIGLPFSNGRTYPADSSGFRVTRPTSTGFQIRDASLEWIQDPSNLGQFYITSPTDSLPVRAAIRNSGTVNIEQPLDVYIRLVNRISATIVYRDTVLVPFTNTDPFTPGQIDTVVFPEKLPLANSGLYTVEIEVNDPNDSTPINDFRGLQIMIRNVPQNDTFVLGHDRFLFPEGPLGVPTYDPQGDGFSSAFRVGKYFSFPFYPATVVGAEFYLYVVQSNAVEPFVYEVLDDGGNGLPSTSRVRDTIDIDTLTGLTLLDNTRLPGLPFYFDQPIVVDTTTGEPGLYVSWNSLENDGDTLLGAVLAHDNVPPYAPSLRTYEVTAGQWAPYRDAARTEFCIRLLVESPPACQPGPRQTNWNGRDTTVQTVCIDTLLDGTDSTYLFVVDGNGNPVVLYSNPIIINSILDPTNLAAAAPAYPNPTAGMLKLPITLRQPASLSLVVHDAMGRTVHSQVLGQRAQGQHVELMDVTHLPASTYFYTLELDGKPAANGRFIKQ